MSYASATYSSVGSIPVAGYEIIVEGTQVPAPVSTTVYQIIPVRDFPSLGTYWVELHYSITGDNTTIIDHIRIEWDTETGVISYNDMYVGTTLPSTFTYATPLSQFYQATDSAHNNYGVKLTAVFAGTAPAVSSVYVNVLRIS